MSFSCQPAGSSSSYINISINSNSYHSLLAVWSPQRETNSLFFLWSWEPRLLLHRRPLKYSFGDECFSLPSSNFLYTCVCVWTQGRSPSFPVFLYTELHCSVVLVCVCVYLSVCVCVLVGRQWLIIKKDRLLRLCLALQERNKERKKEGIKELHY